MLESFTFWLIVVAVLIAYLCVSVGLRWRAEEVRRRANEKQFTGTAFNVSAIAPRIQRLRQDHLAAERSRPHHSFYRTGLMAAARRMVANLMYFRRARPEHETQKHES
jgi:hypothetical protein